MTKHIASCSFGKDSLAQIIVGLQYVGIATDEPRRLARLEGTNKVSLLARYGIDEEKAKDICKAHGLLSPIYDITNRNGCFFCPNASLSELRHLYFNHRNLWTMLHQLQEVHNTSRRCFTKSKTIFDFEQRFRKEHHGEEDESQTDRVR